MVSIYGLKPNARVLDIGCGKGHLVYDLKQLLPEAEVRGFDVSRHGIVDAPAAIRENLLRYRAQDTNPWDDGYFALVHSLGSLHYLSYPLIHPTLSETSTTEE